MFGVIVNPVSGGREAAGLAVQITERITALGEESRIFETGGDGDAAAQTRAALAAGQGSDLVPEAVWGYIRREHLYGTTADLKHLTVDELRPIAMSYLKPKAERATILRARFICRKTRWRRLRRSWRASRSKSTADG